MRKEDLICRIKDLDRAGDYAGRWIALSLILILGIVAEAVCIVPRFVEAREYSLAASDDADDVRERFEGIEKLEKIAVITDSETGVQYLYVRDGFGRSGDTGGLVVLVDADGNPLIAEEAAMAPSDQAAGER